jgi:hypothetical protein
VDSSNVFAEIWGGWIRFGIAFGFAIGALAAVGWLLDRLKVKRVWLGVLLAIASVAGAIQLPSAASRSS